jgi:hypothetical protein
VLSVAAVVNDPRLVCNVDLTVRVTVTGKTGSAVPIRSNPATARLHGPIGGNNWTVVSWIWMAPYCGTDFPFSFRSVGAGKSATVKNVPGSRCDSQFDRGKGPGLIRQH